MDLELEMEGACVPWQNRQDIEPLLINVESEHIMKDEIPSIKIYRSEGKRDPFSIYFCKTKYNAYKILMGLDGEAVEERMTERSKEDLAFARAIKEPLASLQE